MHCFLRTCVGNIFTPFKFLRGLDGYGNVYTCEEELCTCIKKWGNANTFGVLFAKCLFIA